MQRRTLLKFGIISGAVLALVGGAAATIQPGFERGALTAPGREVFRAVGLGVLDKTLPEEPVAKAAALDSLLNDIAILVSALPQHAQTEVSQLLSILSTAAGRYSLAGLYTPWASATAGEVQAALQDMRISGLAVRQQAYGALHDIAAGAYFSRPESWMMLGYPGPLKI
jgi:hypothetical protein